MNGFCRKIRDGDTTSGHHLEDTLSNGHLLVHIWPIGLLDVDLHERVLSERARLEHHVELPY